MTARDAIRRFLRQEDINFLLTNRIPRRALTRFIGWFSAIEQPLLARVSIAAWRLFADVDLGDAKTTRFRSLHECFTRELKPGARPIAADRHVLVSPCDAIVGASGRIDGTTLIQAKGFPFTLEELLADPDAAASHRDGIYVVLRLTSGMYHRFHAPDDCRIEQVTYVAGDTWNVNPIALKRVERLFCRNERAVLRARLDPAGHVVTLVPVAAILVASIRLHFLDTVLHMRYGGPSVIACNAALRRGEEMGWFQHGSTMIVLAPKGFTLCPTVREGTIVRVGEPLLRLP